MTDTYSMMRHFADSWALLVLFLFFVGAFAWVWRPGSRPLHDAAARSILRDDTTPPALAKPGCTKSCATCACAAKGPAA